MIQNLLDNMPSSGTGFGVKVVAANIMNMLDYLFSLAK
jgi:hypothetical protein